MENDCLEQFQNLKLGKKLKWIVYAISKDGKSIVVEKTSANGDYDEFVSHMPAEDCRWAVYDLEFEKGDEGKRNKICFIAWCVELLFRPYPALYLIELLLSGRLMMPKSSPR